MHKDNLGNIDSLPFKYSYGNIIFSKIDYYKFMSYNNYIGDNNTNVSYKDDDDVQKIYHQFDKSTYWPRNLLPRDLSDILWFFQHHCRSF